MLIGNALNQLLQRIRGRNSLRTLSKPRLRYLAYHVEPGLLGGCAGKILIGPDEPAADFLEVSQGLVGAGDCFIGRRLIPQQQDCACLGVAAPLDPKDHAVAHLRMFAECLLQIFRINLQACRGNDHVLAAAFEIEISFGVHGA